ncbi:MAG TPA: LacI family DNA-binding transcriptional regulator [Stellaceae bacterium]|nr:LacI family DNA-binding transcriptional regulator [Stellaceae bacterium]
MASASERKRFHAGQQAAATLGDVARLAGVSPATVSRVLNRPQTVRLGLRDSVQRAIAELGYVPHGAARALASRRSQTIGAVVPTLDNAIFATCIDALQRRLDGAGYVLLLASTEYDRARERSEVAALLERGVDGVMLVGGDHDPAVYRLLAGKRVPFVNTWVYETASGRPCVGFDNRRAAMRMTDYLLDLGHRRFAVIAGVTLHNDRAAERVLGVQAALAARGIALTPAQIIERPYALAEGRDALRLLMRQKEPPTAIICGNDVLAIGALLECLAANIAVPGEISIAGFDDLELASHIQPGLTTLRVPSAGMGRRAAEYLVSRLDGRTVPDCVELDVELIVRGTTAPPP